MGVVQLLVRVSLVWLIATAIPFGVSVAPAVEFAPEVAESEVSVATSEGASVAPRRTVVDTASATPAPTPYFPSARADRPHATPPHSARHLHVSLCRFTC